MVVSHGLLALPSTSDSKPFDGAATAAPGEASFEGQHAALAALGQAVLAALGVAFFQGSTPIDVVGGYVFSLDVLGDALSLDVLTNSNVLHKTGFMGAAPTVVFLGGSEGLNALLLDASAAAALDGVFKGLFGVAALRSTSTSSFLFPINTFTPIPFFLPSFLPSRDKHIVVHV